MASLSSTSLSFLSYATSASKASLAPTQSDPPSLGALCSRCVARGIATWTSSVTDDMLTTAKYFSSPFSFLNDELVERLLADLIAEKRLSVRALALLVDHSQRYLRLSSAVSLSNNHVRQLTQRATGLQCLSLPYATNVSDSTLAELILANHNTLEVLEISHCPKLRHHAARAIGECARLRVLKIRGCRFQDASIAAAVSSLFNLKVFDARDCHHLSRATVNALFTHCKHLEAVDLEGLHTLDGDAMASFPSSLKALSVAGTEVGAHFLLRLSTAADLSLRSLNLANTHVSWADLNAMPPTLFRSVTQLDLTNLPSRGGSSGLNAAMLLEMPHLARLKICSMSLDNLLSAQHDVTMLEVLRATPLTSLHLDGVRFGRDEDPMMAAAVLDSLGVDVEASAVAHLRGLTLLIHGLEGSVCARSLRTLSLKGQEIRPTTAHALSLLPSLQVLDLSSCELGNEALPFIGGDIRGPPLRALSLTSATGFSAEELSLLLLSLPSLDLVAVSHQLTPSLTERQLKHIAEAFPAVQFAEQAC